MCWCVVSMLGQHRRPWTIIETALGQSLVFAGYLTSNQGRIQGGGAAQGTWFLEWRFSILVNSFIIDTSQYYIVIQI